MSPSNGALLAGAAATLSERRLRMLAVLANLTRLGGMQIVIALTAVVRNKVISVRLGPEGYGEFIQLVMVATAASVIAGFGLGMSLNRNAAAAADDRERQRYLAQANAVNLTLGSVLAIAILALALLHPNAFGWIGLMKEPAILVSMLVLVALIPLDAAVQHRIGFLIGIQDIRGMTSGRSTALLIGTVISVPLIWYVGLVGAAIQLVALSLLIVLLLDRRARRLGYVPWALLFDKWTFITLARLGLAAIVAGFAVQLSDLTVRSILLKSWGTAESGIYQSALSLSHQVRAVVLGSVGSYMIAILSQKTDRETVIATTNRLLSVVLPVAMVAFSALGLLAGPLIVLLYSPEFLPAQRILPIMLVGFSAEVMVWVIGAPLLALNRVGVWLTFEILFSALCLLLALPFVGRFGMVAVAAAYAAAAMVHLITNWVYYSKVLHLRIGGRQVLVFALGVLTVAAFSVVGSLQVFDLGVMAAGSVALLLVTAGCLHLVIGLGSMWNAGKSWLTARRGEDA